MKVTFDFYCFFFGFLVVPIHYAFGLNSHRSHIIENGKPILRTGIDNDDNISTTENVNTTDLPWLKELLTRIPQLVQDHGYKDARPFIQELVDDTEKSMNVLLNVKVSHDGNTSVEIGPSFRATKHKNNIKRDKGYSEPSWMTEFKNFIKALVQSYGWNRAKEMMTHLIKTLENQHAVKIVDVDVDQFGEVFVNYVIG